MVDGHLPLEDKARPLSYLFLDLNSYFASVEQQENPELRDRPMAVCPVMADTSFIIAASYPAKKFGVKTGTMIREAKRMCPDIKLVKGRWPLYSAYHKRVIEACETVLPVDQVCSIDEMRFKLLGVERTPEGARDMALRMKEAIYEHVGECMTCSVGIAPNPFLAKVATEMEKPNGLVILEAKDLPEKLYPLKLTDFAGINKRTEIRLNACGIFTTEQMCRATKSEMHQAFGSVIGERWFYLLRGFELAQEEHAQKSLGHSHVLAPDLRTDQGCREVLLRLLQKASARLRASNLWTEEMIVGVHGFKRSWSARIKLPPTQDSVTLTEYFTRAWVNHDFDSPRSVSVTFYSLREDGEVTLSLFDATGERSKLSHAIDSVNGKFGKNSVFLAGLGQAKDSADEKIAFRKTELFSEGKGDNEWIDTFRGAKRPKPEK